MISDNYDTNNSTAFDILEEDPVHLLGGLRFCVLATTRPMDDPSKEHKTLVALKIKGAFTTHSEADAFAKDIAKVDSRYDVLIAPLGKWLMMPVDLSMIGDQKTHDEMLTNILQHHNDKEELERVKFERRKEDLMNSSAAPESDTGDAGDATPSATMESMTSAENVETSSMKML